MTEAKGRGETNGQDTDALTPRLETLETVTGLVRVIVLAIKPHLRRSLHAGL